MNRRFRLNKRTDFERVRRTGQSYAHPLIVLIALPNELPITRVGVSASKAVGGAVQRNRAKRRIRANMTPLMEKLAPGNDVIILARTAIGKSTPEELGTAINRLLKRAKLFA